MVLPGFAGGELWRWRGSNALNRAAFMGLRRYSPAFSGHACPGCGPVDRCVPRILPAASAANPTSSEAGALQAFYVSGKRLNVGNYLSADNSTTRSARPAA